MNFSKIMFLMMMMISTLITINSQNWLGMWMGMEMNLMFFIPVMSKMKNKKSSQAMMIYFLAQSMGSIILLFSILINSFIMISPVMMNKLIEMMLIISLLIKLGVAPFHNWFLEVLYNMNWKEAFLLMTWQKVAPLFILSNIIMNNFIYIIIMLTTLIGAIGGINYSSIMKIMGYSSINHMGWMLLMMKYNNMWYKYLILYSIILFTCYLFFSKNNLYFINQLSFNMKSNMEKLNYMIIMLSMAGLPPFMGFLPKWIVINSSINNNILIIMFMIMMSLLTLFYYLKIINSLLFVYSSTNKWIKIKSNNFMIYLFMLNFMLPAFSIIEFF
uniref:NADH dehydrogenase subunit 2 n=1 Tax=Ninus insignis TaxID=2813438 RepID=UPI002008ED9A|nr:NADH dehydrogenase subunit 2 [Ninus insignis]UPI55261.1 NADH dehydrogenase subunit 2 [Ninus insignis]